MKKYEPAKIEQKWQKIWEETKLYKVDEKSKKPKFYCLDMFPYPSGSGLHVGHPKGYIATDVFSRFKTLQGFEVLHPMGWDAFGLPAENYAIKNEIHPAEAVKENIKIFKDQLKDIGFNYDWDREINTTNPEYYKWTQWIFLQLFKKGLAYESNEPVNWCPGCKTVLSNEDLEAGNCERCGGEVEQRPMRQWVLKITDYADKLLYDLDGLDWEEMIKEQQRNWIGRSEGALIKFDIVDFGEQLEVFTTRADTLFGATFMVLAPEHPLVNKITTKDQKNEVLKYIAETKKKTELERMTEKIKTGVFTGAYAISPVNNEKIPIWISDYVLFGYGTGAVMSVPAHDERDFEFAEKFGIEIREVISPLIVRSQGADSFKEEMPVTERRAVVCVVKHWKEDKYMGVLWKVSDWRGFVIGGIEANEDAASAGLREITEETGYKNVEFIKELGGIVNSKFYQSKKQENRFAHFVPLLFQLRNDEQAYVDIEEKALHEIVWLSKKEMDEFVNREDMRLIWDRAEGNTCFTDEGILENSGKYTGLTSHEAQEKIIQDLKKAGRAEKKVTYRMKDWVFSRQRYWGEPIPIVHCEKCGPVAVPENELPVTLPEVKSYKPTGTGESPLAAITDWVNVKCSKCGSKGKRETDTMPQWAGSSWYYLRYIDPHNTKALVDKNKEKEWMPVDLYVGGAEHATRHLLYARFWHKFLFDIGVVSTEEPFKRLIHVGLIQAEDGRKMSKRWNNVVSPDEIVEKFGADSLRLYEMFMGPFTQNIAWSTKGVIGANRFLNRLWIFKEQVIEIPETKEASDHEINIKNEALKETHRSLAKIEKYIEDFKLNLVVSSFMELSNGLEDLKSKVEPSFYNYVFKESLKIFTIMIAPLAPHIAEEMWQDLGEKGSIFKANWPKVNKEFLREDEYALVIQVNGKVRDEIMVDINTTEEEAFALALESEKIKKWLEGKEIVKRIFVKGKLINIVVK